jgi:hypothetical protein
VLKKNVLGKASAKSLGEAFRCGECLHHKKHPHSSKQEVCSKLGIKAVGIAPSCFTPDITRIAKNADEFVHVVTLFQSFTFSERRVLLGLLRTKTRKTQYPIGTKLYFKVGKDYISNYLCGYVSGYTSSGEMMLMGNPNRSRGQSFVSYLGADAEGLLTHKQWVEKRTELREMNKIHDPSNQVIKKTSIKDKWEPPTIDSAPREWHDKIEREQKKRSKRRLDTMEYMVGNG